MALQEVSKTTKIVLITEFILLAYMFYVLSTSLYKSYQVDRFIEHASEENTRLESENALLMEDFEYYKSDRYKEKIAKQNFGLVRPGEEVIVLIPDSLQSPNANDLQESGGAKRYRAMSNPRKWFAFFFERG